MFWKRYPALLYALCAVTGVAAALYHWGYLFLILFFLPNSITPLLIVLATFLYTHSTVKLPQVPEEGLFGRGTFSISNLTLSHSSHATYYVYRGTLEEFSDGKNIPVTIKLKSTIDPPLADRSWQVEGVLFRNTNGNYTLKTSADRPWIPLQNSFSLAEWRFHAKQWLTKKIQKYSKYRDSANFLAGISTGDFDDALLQFEFSRFSLQHIMAISGFHFSIIAACITFVLRLIFSQRISILCTLLLLSLYFLFLGPGPSVLRAYVTISICLLASLRNTTISGINALGLAVMVLIAWNPLLITTIGFCFSCVSTASILLFYPHFEQFFPLSKHYLCHTITMPRRDQHGYLILNSARQSLALSAAVNVTAIPLTLFYFHTFPLLSIVYNLFFPFLVTISMIFLLATLTLDLISPTLATLLHSINDTFTHTLLAFTSNLPISFDYTIRSDFFNTTTLLITLLLCLWLAIWFSPRRTQRGSLTYK